MTSHDKYNKNNLSHLLERPGFLVPGDFEPAAETYDFMRADCRILVVGAGGLGCELLKDLALTGFGNIDVIDMDTIDISNLNRQFLFRPADVGKAKATVAAERVMERVEGITVTAHRCMIQEKPLNFYEQFHVIVLGLDSLEARRYMNSVVRRGRISFLSNVFGECICCPLACVLACWLVRPLVHLPNERASPRPGKLPSFLVGRAGRAVNAARLHDDICA